MSGRFSAIETSSGAAHVGNLASGGAAFGWLGACGGAAVAHDFAVGGAAMAAHVNDAAARAFVQQSEFFRWALVLSRNAFIFLWLPLGVVIGNWSGWGASGKTSRLRDRPRRRSHARIRER